MNKFWVEVELAGSVGDVDSLVKKLGFLKEEVGLLTDSQDVAPIHEHFGRQGQSRGVTDLSGFFVVARNGDYNAIWGFYGIVPYIYKDLYEVKWKFIDEREQRVLKTRFARYPHGECPNCQQSAIDHTAHKNGWRWVFECPKKEEHLVAAH